MSKENIPGIVAIIFTLIVLSLSTSYYQAKYRQANQTIDNLNHKIEILEGAK